MRDTFAGTAGIILGVVAGLILWGLLLGIQAQRFEPGLWSVRARRIVGCTLDYNGPPYTGGAHRLWLTCGADDPGWQLWPLP